MATLPAETGYALGNPVCAILENSYHIDPDWSIIYLDNNNPRSKIRKSRLWS